MRINIYAEEITDKVEIVEKQTDEGNFTGLRLWLHLPVTLPSGEQAQGPFMHRPDDDDSSAVTFWGKRAMIPVLSKALGLLHSHYGLSEPGSETSAEVATVAGELISLTADDIDHMDPEDLAAKIRAVAASALGQRQ